MRALRILGLALIALVAVGAFSAVSASADEYTATKYPAIIEGTNDPEGGFSDEFTTTAGTVKCSEATYITTIKEKQTDLTTSTVLYNKCTGFGFPATVEMNGCNYRFRINGGASTEGTADLVCPSGKEVTVVAKSGETVKCTVHVPPQTNLGTVTYSRIGASETTEGVTVNANLSAIKYTHTAGSGVGACTSGSGSGTLKAKAITTGREDAGPNHIGITLSSA